MLFVKFGLHLLSQKKKNNITDEKTNLANDIDEPLNAVNNKPNSRIIHHFQYMTWPDFGVPENTEHFLEFLFNVRNINNTIATDGEISNEGSKESVQKRSPIVCHCSAGIGRTGAFVIIDSVLNILEKNQRKRKAEDNLSKASEKVENEMLKENVKALLAIDNDNEKTNTLAITENESILSIDTDENADVQLKKLKSGASPICLLEKLSPSASNASNNTIKDSTKLGIEISASFDSSTSGTSSVAISPSNNLIANEDLMTLVDLVVYIRRSRMGLIQTPQQLRFCWKAIVNWINNNIEISKKI